MVCIISVCAIEYLFDSETDPSGSETNHISLYIPSFALRKWDYWTGFIYL